MELSGEYVGCDGESRRLQVSCEASGDADPLQSLAAGVAQMKELVAEFFGSLVERDAQGMAVDPDDALDDGCWPAPVYSIFGGQKRASNPPEPELQIVESHVHAKKK